MTYAEALAQYHLRPESKFLNGDFCDRGRTERRHVVASQILHIGKEANKWEEQYFLGEDEDAEIEYGVDQSDGSLDAAIREMCDRVRRKGSGAELGYFADGFAAGAEIRRSGAIASEADPPYLVVSTSSPVIRVNNSVGRDDAAELRLGVFTTTIPPRNKWNWWCKTICPRGGSIRGRYVGKLEN